MPGNCSSSARVARLSATRAETLSGAATEGVVNSTAEAARRGNLTQAEASAAATQHQMKRRRQIDAMLRVTSENRPSVKDS